MKAVVNRCNGGFSLSDRAIEMLMKRKGLECFRYKQTKYSFKDGANEYTRCDEFENDSNIFLYYQTEDVGEKIDKLPKETYWHYEDLERTDNDLIEVVEELGVDANGRFAKLEIVVIPDNIEWEVDKNDGFETIHEIHKIW